MRSITALWIISWAVLLSTSCSESKPDPPPREQVEALLQQEADNMKREGEADVNPSLGVKVTWTIQGVEVRPQTGNEDEPWAGTIRFLIESQTPDLDGTATEQFERSYDYAWSLTSSSWLMR